MPRVAATYCARCGTDIHLGRQIHRYHNERIYCGPECMRQVKNLAFWPKQTPEGKAFYLSEFDDIAYTVAECAKVAAQRGKFADIIMGKTNG